ncbi:hypothetical protein AGABI2DRAFT_45523, partial [Agaricus bisporus var. bisporus H97]|uniref:hypothetical protein n=1 Tax=Agaricus bisporus var. bisporus (strain H97 / ATCC MYA-4626 / FGSC 10389) TaxID=936046 RepID=UPI00029F6D08
GNVKMKKAGHFNWLWRNKWLELREQSLTICSRKKSTHQTIISSQDIATIERATMKPHCLFLEVRGKKYWLSLTSDEELYGWLDDLIHHCHRNSITAPENFVHHVHVSYDYIAERFQGLPIQWQKILDVSGCSFEE